MPALTDRLLRVAVVQLQCHAAASVGGKDYLGEPFVDGSFLPLDHLIRLGLSVESNRRYCRRRYIEWHEERLKAIVKYLGNLTRDDPASAKKRSFPPHVILFPEYAVPFECLGTLRQAASDLKAIVVAGTHALPAMTEQNLARYRELGFDDAKINMAYRSLLPTRSLLPVFFWDADNQQVRTWFRQKGVLSPFELANTGPHVEDTDVTARSVQTFPLRAEDENSRQSISCELLVCSEALQLDMQQTTRDSYSLVLIPAYNAKAEPFEPIIEQFVKNQKAVLFSNDGHCGGSSIRVPPGFRGDSWWFDEPNFGRLPPGDSVFVADLTIDRLSEVAQVNNPHERFRMVSLSAVVPDSAKADSTTVALCLDRLRELESPSLDGTLNGVNITQRNRVLDDCLESKHGTALQQRKLLRLRAIEAIDPAHWAIHASDVRYTHADDLARLERKLTRHCMDSVRRLRVRDGISETQDRALYKVRQRCTARMREHSHSAEGQLVDLVANSAWAFFRDVSKRSKHDAQRNLTDAVAILVERFRASSAWLFVNVPQRSLGPDLTLVDDRNPLKLVVAHNTRFKPAELPMTPAFSLAGEAAHNRAPVCHNDIIFRYGRSNIPNFMPVKVNTQSAVAVPVLIPQGDDTEVLGVLVIEATRRNTFLPADVAELTVEVNALAEALLVVRSLQSEGNQFVWYPPSRSWDITKLLNDFCFSIATSLPDRHDVPGFGITVWYSDIQDKKAFALGTVRFDSDYLTQRFITTFQKGSQGWEPASLVGKTLRECPETFHRGDWEEERLFQRQEKARRTELREVVYGCIPWTTGIPQPKEEDGLVSKGLGVLTFYFYQDEYRLGVEGAASLFEGATGPRLADMISRFLSANHTLQKAVSSSVLRSRLRVDSLTGLTTFNIIRDVIMEVLDADGCSIFAFMRNVPSGKNDELRCVSTSGLVRDGEELSRQDASYEIKKEYLSDLSLCPHMTVRVALNPDEAIRVNWGMSGHEFIPSRPRPSRSVETYLLSENEHRRFMACAVKNRAGDVVGVIRIVRAMRHRPFTHLDYALLQSLSDESSLAFTYRDIERRELDLANNQVSRLDHLSDSRLDASALKVRKQTVYECARRLFSPMPGYSGWSRRRVDCVLQDLFQVFDTCDSILSMLRVVGRDNNGREELRSFAYHSRDRLDVSEETAGEPIRRAQRSISWDALINQNIVEFRRTDQAFVAISHIQGSPLHGICIPFSLWFGKEIQPAVLSIEVKQEVDFEESHVRVLLAAAEKLLCLSLGTIERTPKAEPILASGFLRAWVDGKFQKELEGHAVSMGTSIAFLATCEAGCQRSGDAWIFHKRGVDSFDLGELWHQLVSSEEYSPEGQLAFYAYRDPIEEPIVDTSHERCFGRPSQSAERLFFPLRWLEARLDHTTGRCYLPIRYLGYEFGGMIFQFKQTSEMTREQFVAFAQAVICVAYRFAIEANQWRFQDLQDLRIRKSPDTRATGRGIWRVDSRPPRGPDAEIAAPTLIPVK